MSIPGGFGSPKAVTEEEQLILDAIKAECETQAAKSFSTFTGIEFLTQVVAGTNYLFKVEVDGGEVMHVKVHKPLPHTQQPNVLVSVSGPHTPDVPLAA